MVVGQNIRIRINLRYFIDKLAGRTKFQANVEQKQGAGTEDTRI